MSSEKLYFRTPNDLGHAHFYDTIGSFPGLQAGASFEDKDKYIRDTIKHQLMTTTPEQAKRSTLPVMKSSTSVNASASPRDHKYNSASTKKYPGHP